MQESELIDEDQQQTQEPEEDPIAAKWAEIEGRMKGEEDAPEPEAAESSAAEDDSAQKARDERGRFAKSGGAAEPAVEAAAEPVAQPQASADTPDGWDINRAPASLSPAAKAEWDKLPESWRREIHKREADAHRGVQQILPDARFGQQIRQMTEPYRAFMAASGSSPEQAVAGLLQTDAMLRTGTPAQKQHAFRMLAQQYGVDISQQQEQGEAYQQPQQFHDPRLDQLIAAQHRAEQQRESMARQQQEGEVGTWMNETDAQGKPLRPYIDNVSQELVALIPAIQQLKPGASTREVMEEAYTRAVWANPATRAVLEQQAMAKLEADRRAENLRRVEDAKKAASVNVARRGVVPPKPNAPAMPDFIEHEARRLGLLS